MRGELSATRSFSTANHGHGRVSMKLGTTTQSHLSFPCGCQELNYLNPHHGFLGPMLAGSWSQEPGASSRHQTQGVLIRDTGVFIFRPNTHP